MENQNNAKPKNILKKKFTSWKTYLLVAVIFWFFSILMAGSIIGEIIMAASLVPMFLGIIYILGGIFGKKDRNILLKKGKEYLVAGTVLYLIHFIVYRLSDDNPTVRQVVYATNGIMGIVTLLLVISGVICLIRGYLSKESVVKDSEDQTKKGKIKVTHEELGKALFMFVYKIAWDNFSDFSDKKTLKDLGLEKKDRRHLVLEATAALFYLTITTLEGFLNNENLEKKVFDGMHEALYKGLDLDEKKTKEMQSHFIKRYAEYQDATKEKRGPNWLWPLTHHILNNLRQEETKDVFAMGHLTAFLTSVMESIPKLISEYKIISSPGLSTEQFRSSEEESQVVDKTKEGGTYIF